MEFIGKDGKPAPRLRDVNDDKVNMSDLYLDTIKLIRNLFVKARLVHGDLSEYNILYHDK